MRDLLYHIVPNYSQTRCIGIDSTVLAIPHNIIILTRVKHCRYLKKVGRRSAHLTKATSSKQVMKFLLQKSIIVTLSLCFLHLDKVMMKAYHWDATVPPQNAVIGTARALLFPRTFGNKAMHLT